MQMNLVTRCPWLNLKNARYVNYHDREWGRPVRDDRSHLECLTLEGAQAGLSWETILAKREGYRRAFAHFDPTQVAGMGARDIERLLEDGSIVRHRGKIESTLSNARLMLKIAEEYGSYKNYIEALMPEGAPIIANPQDQELYHGLSQDISDELKSWGFRFVGPTIIHSYLQATGLIQDHSAPCELEGLDLHTVGVAPPI
jgi:DNA-3-methyladenine glycosylase I